MCPASSHLEQLAAQIGGVGLRFGLMLRGDLAVLQAPEFDGHSLDTGAPVEDGFVRAEVEGGGRRGLVKGLDRGLGWRRVTPRCCVRQSSRS